MQQNRPRPSKKRPKKSVITKQSFITVDDVKRVGSYQILESIGKGAFGAVYRGVDIKTGTVVAIKRIPIIGVDKDEQASIEGEIDLLKNLVHKNIVTYVGVIREQYYLNIILEYVEGGPLSSLVSRFGGQLPERLCRIYIAQVLRGLEYLHQQGVIHRDIKGANILSDKSGVVKLADFGVATKLSDARKSESVVGTPYWMAPEIIEMTGIQGAACDIWSVGCTLIELLTGKPPYFDLGQMPALFKIVQDDHPPLPDDISPALNDFMLQCFAKNPFNRPTASKLLKHPWLKEIEDTDATQQAVAAAGAGNNANANAANAMATLNATVQKTEEELQQELAAEAEDLKTLGQEKGSREISADTLALSDLPGIAQRLAGTPELPDENALDGLSDVDEPDPTETNPDPNNKTKNNKQVHADDDDSVSPAKLPPMLTIPEATEEPQTIQEVTGTKEQNDAKEQPKPVAPEDDLFAERSVPAIIQADRDDLFAERSVPAIIQADRARLGSPRTPDANPPQPKPAGQADPILAKVTATPFDPLSQFMEGEEDEGVDDLELKESDLDLDHHHNSNNEALEEAVSEPMEWDGGDQDDPFDDIAFFDAPGSNNDELRVAKQFARVVEDLSPHKPEHVVLAACDKMVRLIKENPREAAGLITSHNGGVIPIMELLEVSSRQIMHAVLKMINEIVDNNSKFQQTMSMVGLVPAMIKFAGSGYPIEIRIEAANFIRQFSYSSDFTRKMFIACGGLPCLVNFLHEDYGLSRTLVWNSIDCIRHVFDITTSPKNHFCRLFCKFGLLPPLSKQLRKCNNDKLSPNASHYVRKICEVVFLFSQGDNVVKQHFAKPIVLENMLAVLPQLPQESLLLILKSLRNIAMDPATLDLLESAGAIPALIPFLNGAAENQNQVLACMYDLVKIKSTRQNQAAEAGIIPHLQRIIQSDLTIKQFAYPLIFVLSHSSTSRMELKKHGGVQFYVNLLTEPYWRTYALRSITSWLQDDPGRVSFILSKSNNITKLIEAFESTTNPVQLEKILPLFRQIISISIRINQALGRSEVFTKALLARLQHDKTNNSIRINLLKILALVLVAHKSPKILVKQQKLIPLLKGLEADNQSVIVLALVSKLIAKWT
eukprot:gb/GEZN01000888.1/.p1 GENE.gb/GEZN01000888.1/~~gb/GEZN01000888.1/.p1  ORF type:complete len:1118 (-),score=151.66 gb/GEZN01000888.1/:33-3386(-)